jgi:hypothetical protein
MMTRTALIRGMLACCAALILASGCQLDSLVSSRSGTDSGENGEPTGGNGRSGETTLSFTVQPGNSIAGMAISPAIEVTARNSDGGTNSAFTGVITLALGSNPADGTLSGPASRAASNGVATFAGLSIDKAGSGYRLEAAAQGAQSQTSVSFAVSAAPGNSPARIELTGGAGQSGPVGQPLVNPYSVRVTTSNGAPVAGVTVTWAVLSGGGSITAKSTTNSSGVATAVHVLGSQAGTQQASATVAELSGSPVTFTATATPGPPARLIFQTQPSDTQAGETISPAVRVRVEDSFGNNVTGSDISLTIAIAPGTGTPLAKLSGNRTVTVVEGIATFGNLRIDLPGLSYRLVVAGGGLEAVSAPFNVSFLSDR